MGGIANEGGYYTYHVGQRVLCLRTAMSCQEGEVYTITETAPYQGVDDDFRLKHREHEAGGGPWFDAANFCAYRLEQVGKLTSSTTGERVVLPFIKNKKKWRVECNP